MFFNFSNFLNSTMRILNIANRAIPLVREINPTIKNFRSRISNSNLPRLNLLRLPNDNNINNSNIKKESMNNNSLTFFR